MMPHVYPPSISTVTRSDLANTPGYYRRLTNSFGYLNKQVRQIRVAFLWTFHPESAPHPVQEPGQHTPLVVVAPHLAASWRIASRLTWSNLPCVAAMQGYCSGGTCQKFPVIFGEFGSRMRDCRNRCAVAGCMPLELSVSSPRSPVAAVPHIACSKPIWPHM